jgi:hypothetical protein
MPEGIKFSAIPPGGRADNSPVIYRWVTSLMTDPRVPEGRMKTARGRIGFTFSLPSGTLSNALYLSQQ